MTETKNRAVKQAEFYAVCHGCHVAHPIHASPNDVGVSAKFGDFANNHRGEHCQTALVQRPHVFDGQFGGKWTDIIRKRIWKSPFALIRDAFRAGELGLKAFAAPDIDWLNLSPDHLRYVSNADVKAAFQTIQTMTITNFSGLATSATAGWQSAQVDNTSNLYLDTLMQFTNTAVNTAPANSKAILFFAFGGNATGTLTDFGAAVTGTSEATLTFADVTSNAVQGLVYVQPYPTQNKALVSNPFSMKLAFGDVLPSYWGVAAINHSGMTLGTVTMKYQGTFKTVI